MKHSKLSSYQSARPDIEGNSGIWFEEEDPQSEKYNPKYCTNVYLDLARGRYDCIDAE